MRFNRSLGLSLAISFALICIGAALVLAIRQETPTGSLRGTVVADESGNPLPASVMLTAIGTHGYHSTEASTDGSFQFTRLPAGDYTMEISSKAHSMDPVHVTIDEGKTRTIEAELSPNDPYLNLYIHQHISTPDERPQITCNGFAQSDTLDIRVYKVDLDAFLLKSGGELNRLLGIQSYYGNSGTPSTVNLDANSALKLVKTNPTPITTRDYEGVFTQRIDLPVLEPGLYVTSASVDNIRQLGWIMVTALGMVTKTVGDQTLAYTVDLKTGRPVPASEVTVYIGQNSVASGKTDGDGLLTIKLPSPSGGESEQTIVAHSGKSFAFTSAYFSSTDQSNNLIYAYTDRPVYKPGQQVFFKGIVRQQTTDKYAVKSGQPVTVEVRDSRDTLIYRTTRRTDKFGAYSGSLPLNSETATGTYTLISTVEGQGRGESIDFQVAAYRKPEFSVKVTFSQKRYVRGNTVRARISANYFFGAPLANADVKYLIHRSPFWLFTVEDDDEDSYGGYEDYGGYGEVVDEGTVRTDSNGNADVEFPADWPQPVEANAWDTDQEFSVEANVTDKGDREVSGTGSVVVTRGEFAIDVQPDQYVVEPGQTVNVLVTAMDYDKHPVKHQEITVVTGRDVWSDDEESKFQAFGEQTVTTDDSGRAIVKVSTNRAGSMQIIAKSRDRHRNLVSSIEYIWAYGDGGGIEETTHQSDLQILTDKKTYNPGDVAKVLINSRFRGMTALLTVEGSQIYEHRTVRLTGNSTLVQVPVKSDYKPNFYISVCLVKNKNFFTQTARAKVSLRPQSLDIKISPDKAKYLPGEKAVYKITATDSHGKPARAQLSLGVVDEAIYAIAEDTTTPILDYFYARKPNMVTTNFSFPQIYLSDPDKAGSSLLKTPPRNTKIRKRFLDTAYWNPNIETGADGTAVVSFHLPDNLTTWRATVHGITQSSLCGDAKNTVLAQQDFLVQLEAPRFLVQTDKSMITAVVHNYTGEGQKVAVALQSPGLDIDGRTRRDVFIRSGGAERINWDISAPNPGAYDITVRATTSKTGDAMQISLPVYPHGMERTTQTVGTVSGNGSTKVNIEVRNDSIPSTTRLRLRLAPSLASTMLGSLQYLAEYPYGCTEQTASSFLPDVILYSSFKDLGMNDRKLQAELPDMVTKGLFRLYRFQLNDGGWSWCEYGKSDPWMTAYVCYSLVRARSAGFHVNDDILSKGLSRLTALSELKKLDVSTRAYCLYVLALSGRDENKDLDRIAGEDNLDAKTLALLALAYHQSGHGVKAKSAVDRLLQRAISEQGMIHWAGPEQRWYFNGGDVEATALALEAMLKVEPKDARVSQIVRWLMDQRRGDAWYSTRDTAMVLYAMAEYFKSSKELSPNSDVVVSLNGRAIGRTHFGKASLFEPEIEISTSDLHKGRNVLEIAKKGAGNVYYSTSLTQYVARKFMPEMVNGSGITIHGSITIRRTDYRRILWMSRLALR